MIESEGTTAAEAEGARSAKTEARANQDSLCGTIGKAFRMAADAFGPPEAAAKHFRDARKEVLLGFRELIDARLEQLSRKENKGTRIVVE